jgi:glycosyltransferase involved in cell wall biosynthesis
MGMKTVLVISFSDLANDPRVSRQIAALSTRYRVLAAGTAPPAAKDVEFFQVPPRERRSRARQALSALKLKVGAYERYYWAQSQVRWCRSALAHLRPDAIVANDLVALPLALRLNAGAGVVYDAHEYSPREMENHLAWRFFFQDYNDYLCRTYLPQARAMMTVCDGIADEYRACYGVRPEVLTNAPPYHELEPAPTDPGVVRMIHHGGAIPMRRIDLMIEAMDHLDGRFHLDLMLMPTDPRCLEQLRRLAEGRPRVKFVPTVPMAELPRHINRYDVGLYLLPPNNFNNRMALPNKFFEFVQARLAVAIGPSPEMARLVQQYDCGVVSAEFTPRSIAASLAALDAQRIAHYKQRSHLAARELCFERNSEVLLDMVDRVMGAR